MIHVVAILTAHPGQRAAVLAAFRENMPAVHAEAGCIAYQPVVDAEDIGPMQARIGEDSFMVIETWASAAALQSHAAAPHMAEYGRKTKGLLASRVIHVLSPA
jgi:quinol monooxygenase YgiN